MTSEPPRRSFEELVRLESIRNGLWQASFQKMFLEEAGAADGLFLLQALFDEALPAAEAALEESSRESAARADRIAADALALTGLVREARFSVLPVVAEAQAELARAGFATRWIPEEQASLSARAATLAARAAREDASAAIRGLGSDLADFRTRAGRILELSARLPEVRAGIKAGENRVREVRQVMGSALGLPPASLLREPDRDPSERLAGADWQANAAGTALDLGDVDATESALEQAEQLIAEAAALLDRAGGSRLGSARTLSL